MNGMIPVHRNDSGGYDKDNTRIESRPDDTAGSGREGRFGQRLKVRGINRLPDMIGGPWGDGEAQEVHRDAGLLREVPCKIEISAQRHPQVRGGDHPCRAGAFKSERSISQDGGRPGSIAVGPAKAAGRCDDDRLDRIDGL